MDRARLTRPSCIVMLLLFLVGVGVILWLAFGSPLRTPSPAAVTKETPTYDTDVPSGDRPG